MWEWEGLRSLQVKPGEGFQVIKGVWSRAFMPIYITS